MVVRHDDSYFIIESWYMTFFFCLALKGAVGILFAAIIFRLVTQSPSSFVQKPLDSYDFIIGVYLFPFLKLTSSA